MDENKYWNVDLTSDFYIMNASLTRVPAFDAKHAEEQALSLMKNPGYWRVTGLDRC